MKKVLVLAAALALFATPAMALITGTAHDLSAPAVASGGADEICVYCHTPHGATTVNGAPLWNRGTTAATGVYASGTVQNVADNASVNLTDAPLCLSCHDGDVAGALNNEPNGGAADFTAFDLTWNGNDTNLTDDMTNDHPIGFSYAAVILLDSELDTKANAETDLGTGALSFGGGDDMWCSSCHDVHGVGVVPTFLRMDNTDSALCKACHLK